MYRYKSFIFCCASFTFLQHLVINAGRAASKGQVGTGRAFRLKNYFLTMAWFRYVEHSGEQYSGDGKEVVGYWHILVKECGYIESVGNAIVLMAKIPAHTVKICPKNINLPWLVAAT